FPWRACPTSSCVVSASGHIRLPIHSSTDPRAGAWGVMGASGDVSRSAAPRCNRKSILYPEAAHAVLPLDTFAYHASRAARGTCGSAGGNEGPLWNCDSLARVTCRSRRLVWEHGRSAAETGSLGGGRRTSTKRSRRSLRPSIVV